MESRRVFFRGSQGITKGNMGVGNHLLDPAISVEGPCKMREATFTGFLFHQLWANGQYNHRC